MLINRMVSSLNPGYTGKIRILLMCCHIERVPNLHLKHRGISSCSQRELSRSLFGLHIYIESNKTHTGYYGKYSCNST